jgi:hypothetical protein
MRAVELLGVLALVLGGALRGLRWRVVVLVLWHHGRRVDGATPRRLATPPAARKPPQRFPRASKPRKPPRGR